MDKYTIAVLGSHSALDVCRGAKDLGFRTLVVTQKGRSSVYSNYYKTEGDLGCVDEILELDKFSDLLTVKAQTELKKRNCIFIPHRSFEVYLDFDYKGIETKFKVPIFGNKYLLKSEERGTRPNQYDILDKAKINYPKQFTNPKKISGLCIVKVLEKERGFERAFFLVDSYDDFVKEAEDRMKNGLFTKEQLAAAVIEEFIMGVQVNLNFFYSPINQRLELLGTDTRRQTNIEGLSRIPAPLQDELLEKINLKYEEGGHIAVTILESMIGNAMEIGERFVKAAKQTFKPGVIGPFGLQSVVIPGPPKKDFVVFDVAPRMPGSPGTFSTPYSGYLFGENISVGKRVAMEIKSAIENNKLELVIT